MLFHHMHLRTDARLRELSPVEVQEVFDVGLCKQESVYGVCICIL